MTGPILFMVVLRRLFPMIVLNHLENQSLQPLPLMLTISSAWQRVHHLLHVSISAIILQLTGTPRNKQLWKLQHMDQSCGSQDSHRTDHGY